MDEVTYGELEKEEAQPLVTKYKEEARKLLPPSEKRTNRRNNRNKRNRQNRSRGQGYGESWGPAGPQPQSVLCAEQDPQGNQVKSLTRNKEVTSLWSLFLPVSFTPSFLCFFCSPSTKGSYFSTKIIVSLTSNAWAFSFVSFSLVHVGFPAHDCSTPKGFVQRNWILKFSSFV